MSLKNLTAVHTSTLHDLVVASHRSQGSVHGRVWAAVDGRSAYLETALFGMVRLVKHLAFSVFGLLTLYTQWGRSVYFNHMARAQIDLMGIFTGAVGTLHPWAGQQMTAAAFRFIDAGFLEGAVTNHIKLEEGIATPELAIIDQFHRAEREAALCRNG